MSTKENSEKLSENNSVADRFTVKARLNLNDLLRRKV